MSQPAIRVRGLRKVFRPTTGFFRRGEPKVAIDDIDFDLAEGEMFVLLGLNGAGKTTLVKILSTLVLPTAGEAQVYGLDVERDDAAVRRLIGLASPDERSFYWRLTGRQNLDFFAALHGLRGRAARERVGELVERLDLTEFADRRFDGYSSGMKQRVALARSLLGAPRLLFLDEPTRSLDPTAQKQTRALVQELSSQGTAIFLVTHQLDEARELGARFGHMVAGKLRVYSRGEVDPGSLF